MRQHMALQKTDATGSSILEQCEVVQQRTGVWPKQYPLPEIPDEGIQIWDCYWQIRRGVAFGVNGPNPLPYTEIEAWGRLFGVSLGFMDLRMLFALDKVFLDCYYEEQKKQMETKKRR